MASPSHKLLFGYQHLAKLVTYHPLTGLIYWKEKPKTMRHWHFLKPAGWFDSKGYCLIRTSIFGKQFTVKQHNLAWFIVYGKLPKEGFSIDHKNDRKADNRLKNLRLLSDAGQMIARKRGSHLPPWVYLNSERGKFVSRVHILGKSKFIGGFDDPWEAHTVAADFAIKNGLISSDEYALLNNEWKEFRGGKNG